MGGEPGNRDCPFLRNRLRTDPLFRAEVEAARAWSTPPSVLRGRVVADGEAVWTEKDRLTALALLEEERNTHSCGHPIDEAFAKDNDGKYVGEAIRCHACAASQREAKDFEDNPEGLFVIARKVD